VGSFVIDTPLLTPQPSRGGRMDSKQAAEIVRKLDAEAAAIAALKEI
jgi:hypothetical protein